MKNILLFLPCVFLILLMSCDHRNSKSEHLKHAVSEFNKNQKSIHINTYYPEYYTEIKTDSIISNTFKVSLNNFASKNDNILISESQETWKNTREFHRVFQCDVVVSVSDRIIIKERFSAETFRDNKGSKFWINATLEHVWVNQDLSNQNTLTLGISFINPKTKAFKHYEMHIDPHGNERLMLIEDHS